MRFKSKRICSSNTTYLLQPQDGFDYDFVGEDKLIIDGKLLINTTLRDPFEVHTFFTYNVTLYTFFLIDRLYYQFNIATLISETVEGLPAFR